MTSQARHAGETVDVQAGYGSAWPRGLACPVCGERAHLDVRRGDGTGAWWVFCRVDECRAILVVAGGYRVATVYRAADLVARGEL